MQLLTQCTLHTSQQMSHRTNGSLTNNYSTFLVSINTFLACLHLACPDIICSSSAHLSTTGNQASLLEAQLKRHCIRSSGPQGYCTWQNWIRWRDLTQGIFLIAESYTPVYSSLYPTQKVPHHYKNTPNTSPTTSTTPYCPSPGFASIILC